MNDELTRRILDMCHTAERLMVNPEPLEMAVDLKAYVYIATDRPLADDVPQRTDVVLRLSRQPEAELDDGLQVWDLELVRCIRPRTTVHDDALAWLARLTGQPEEALDD